MLLEFDEFRRQHERQAGRREKAAIDTQAELDNFLGQYSVKMQAKLAELDKFGDVLRPTSDLDIQTIIDELKRHAKDLRHLRRTEEYLQRALSIELLNDRIEKSLRDKSIDKAVDGFKELGRICLSEDFEGLGEYYRDCVEWAERFIDIFLTNTFMERLSAVGWPKRISSDKLTTLEMDELLKSLDSLVLFSANCSDANIYERAVRAMVVPIKLRFKFHYATDRPTNRLDRPEWFLAFLIQMAETHESMVSNVFELDVEEDRDRDYSFLESFIKGLVDIAAEHISEQKSRRLEDPYVLMHTVDEWFKFLKVIRERFGVDLQGIPNPLLGTDSEIKAWIDAQYEASYDSVRTMLEESPLWSEEPLDPVPSSGALMTDIIQFLQELITTLHSLPQLGVRMEFLNRVLRSVFEVVYDKIDFEIPAFHNTVEDVHALIIQANALCKLIKLLKDDWGESLESIVLAGSIEYQTTLGYDASKVPGSIFNKTIESFQELLDRVQESLYSYLWEIFHGPASSFVRSMHYGVVRANKGDIGMHDDLRKAMVMFSEAFHSAIPYLAIECREAIQSKLLVSFAMFVYSKWILQNYFRLDYVEQFQRDFSQFRSFIEKLMPEQPVEMALQRSLEAIKVINLAVEDRGLLRQIIHDEDLDAMAERLQSLHISLLSISECEKVLNLIKP